MAPAVGRLWITANGAAVDGMADRLAAVPNVAVTDAADGRGLGAGACLRRASAQLVTSRRAKCRNGQRGEDRA